jgi:hypothetical protein
LGISITKKKEKKKKKRKGREEKQMDRKRRGHFRTFELSLGYPLPEIKNDKK